MDFLGWLGLVVFCFWWIRASADGMGRKFLSKLNGARPILMEMAAGISFCVFGPYLLYFLFLPYLWQDQKTLEMAKLLALL